jgi:hypothetical protein
VSVGSDYTQIHGKLKDGNANVGSAGQILSTTGTQTDWIDQPSAVVPNVYYAASAGQIGSETQTSGYKVNDLVNTRLKIDGLTTSPGNVAEWNGKLVIATLTFWCQSDGVGGPGRPLSSAWYWKTSANGTAPFWSSADHRANITTRADGDGNAYRTQTIQIAEVQPVGGSIWFKVNFSSVSNLGVGQNDTNLCGFTVVTL